MSPCGLLGRSRSDLYPKRYQVMPSRYDKILSESNRQNIWTRAETRSTTSHDNLPGAEYFDESEIQGNVCTRVAMSQQNTTDPNQSKVLEIQRWATENHLETISVCFNVSWVTSVPPWVGVTKPLGTKSKIAQYVPSLEDCTMSRTEQSLHQAESYMLRLSVSFPPRGDVIIPFHLSRASREQPKVSS